MAANPYNQARNRSYNHNTKNNTRDGRKPKSSISSKENIKYSYDRGNRNNRDDRNSNVFVDLGIIRKSSRTNILADLISNKIPKFGSEVFVGNKFVGYISEVFGGINKPLIFLSDKKNSNDEYMGAIMEEVKEEVVLTICSKDLLPLSYKF